MIRKIVFIIFIYFIAFSGFSQSNSILVPEFDSDEELKEFLDDIYKQSFIRSTGGNSLTKAEVLEYLKKQIELENEIIELKIYKNAQKYSNNSDLMYVEVYEKVEGVSDFDAGLLDSFSKDLNYYLSSNSSLESGITVENVLDKFILNRLTELQSSDGKFIVSSSAVITALITSIIDKELQRKIFSAGDPSEQLRLLSKLADTKFDLSRVNNKRLGLSSEDISSKDNLQKAAENFFALEKELFSLLFTYALGVEKLKYELDLTKYVKKIRKVLRSSNKTSVLGIDEFRIEWWADNSRIKNSVLLKYLKGITERGVKDLKPFVQDNSETKSKPIYGIQEVPPFLGIFRGCIGNDCSTSSSWPFPNSPLEHVFYIYSLEGKQPRSIGYVTVTELTSRKSRTMYIKDLTGHRLKEGEVPIILEAVAKLKKTYGAKYVNIATATWVNNDVHEDVVQEALLSYIEKGDEYRQYFKDNELRNWLKAKNSGDNSYDKIEKHEYGVTFESDKSVTKQYTFEVKKGEFLVDVSYEISDDQKAQVLSKIEMYFRDGAEAVAEESAVIRANVVKLANRLANTEELLLEDYYENLKVSFEKFGITLSSSFIKKHAHWFVKGHLNTEDAFSTESKAQRNKSDRYIDQVIASQHYYEYGEIIEYHASYISESARVNKRIERYLENNSIQTTAKLAFLAYRGVEPAVQAYEKLGGDIQLFKDYLISFLEQEKSIEDKTTTINPIEKVIVENKYFILLKNIITPVGDNDQRAQTYSKLEVILNEVFDGDLTRLIETGILEKFVVSKGKHILGLGSRSINREKYFKNITLPYMRSLSLADPMFMFQINLYFENGMEKEFNKLSTILLKKLVDINVSEVNGLELLMPISSIDDKSLKRSHKDKIIEILEKLDVEAVLSEGISVKLRPLILWYADLLKVDKLITNETLNSLSKSLDNNKWPESDLIYTDYAISVLFKNIDILSEPSERLLKELKLSARYEDSATNRAYTKYLYHQLTGKELSESKIAKFEADISESNLTKREATKVNKLIDELKKKAQDAAEKKSCKAATSGKNQE